MAQNASHKITVSVSSEKLALMADAVESGEYNSQSEILQDALDLWESKQELIHRETEWLKREHEDGLASGLAEDLSPEERLRRIKAEFGSRA
jgi:antitoxin ParD1/3/4